MNTKRESRGADISRLCLLAASELLYASTVIFARLSFSLFSLRDASKYFDSIENSELFFSYFKSFSLIGSMGRMRFQNAC